MGFGQDKIIKPKADNPSEFRIFVVRTIDDAIQDAAQNSRHVIEATYKGYVKDVVYVLINEAKRAVERNGSGYYVATDDEDVAEQYEIKFIETKV